MKRKLEPVPELRVPEDWEHELVSRTLINRYRSQTKQGIRWSSIVSCLFGVILIDIMVSGAVSFGSMPALILMALLCFYLAYTSNKSNEKMKHLVERMERREYRLAHVWAVKIRCVTGEGRQEAYGLAHVRLGNGRLLEKEYVLPYDYAAGIVKQQCLEDQEVLLVYVPILEVYRLIPISPPKKYCAIARGCRASVSRRRKVGED